ncbi:MAG: flagellar protein FlgN [Spirochaetes bacterium]|nr:flagellar protein FlgN [Spirochaetota bacterium]
MYDKKTLMKVMEIIKDEKMVLEKITALEEEKSQLLTEKAFVDLTPINEQEEELVSQLHSLEKERMFTGTTMCKNSDVDLLKELICMVDEDQKNELIQIQHSMNALIERLQFLKSTNQQMLENSLDMIDLTMEAVNGERNEHHYNEKGESENTGNRGKSILINKSI